MAYSDYGGYAYRNGERVEDRSDCTITPEGDTFGTPGCWPGFAAMLLAHDKEELEKRLDYPEGHAVLGDGPIYAVLYKQGSLNVYRGFECLDDVTLIVGAEDGDIAEYKGQKYIDTDRFDERMCVLEVDGCRIEIWREYTDNYYQYVCLTQPDGTVWAGWSGYGVGAGLEDAGYRYSTSQCERRVRAIFPNAFSAQS